MPIAGLGLLMVSGALLITDCQRGGSEIWIVERDIPQTRNLIPVLNRTTLVAAGAGGRGATCAVTWNLAEPNVRKGRFWPEFGSAARMGLPVIIPEGFPDPEPRVVEAPEIGVEGERAVLKWGGIRLKAGEGAAVHASTWLGPPDMYHTAEGLAFGDIRVVTEYMVAGADAGEGAAAGMEQRDPGSEIAGRKVRGQAERAGLEAGPGFGSGSVTLRCRITLTNTHTEPVEGLEFAFFFPRALLDNATGREIPLLESFAYKAEGFSDPAPLDLLISDGLGRGAWGPRFVSRRERLAAGESLSYSVEVRGTVGEGEALIVPLVSLMARIAARYWPSSEVEVDPPGEVHYSDYTHFNLVVADSRLFRLEGGAARVEPSSPEVRRFLGAGLTE